MLHAPGVTTWQYTLLQLQVRPSSPPPFPLCPEPWSLPGVLTAPQTCNPGVSGFSLKALLPSLPSSPLALFTEGGAPGPEKPAPPPPHHQRLSGSLGVAPSQVNGVLPVLPLLFPVLWVLATACGEARVLAQMSKGSPSSLVRCSKASGQRVAGGREGTRAVQKEPKAGTGREGRPCPSNQEQRSSPRQPSTWAGTGQLHREIGPLQPEGLQARSCPP